MRVGAFTRKILDTLMHCEMFNTIDSLWKLGEYLSTVTLWDKAVDIGQRSRGQTRNTR